MVTSLRGAFELVEDPRRAQSRRHPLTAMLTLIAIGLLMGGRDMLNIWRKVACLDQRQREAIGLRVRHTTSKRPCASSPKKAATISSAPWQHPQAP